MNEAKLEHSEALHKVSLIDAHIANVEASLLTVEKQSLDFEITKKTELKSILNFAYRILRPFVNVRLSST